VVLRVRVGCLREVGRSFRAFRRSFFRNGRIGSGPLLFLEQPGGSEACPPDKHQQASDDRPGYPRTLFVLLWRGLLLEWPGLLPWRGVGDRRGLLRLLGCDLLVRGLALVRGIGPVVAR